MMRFRTSILALSMISSAAMAQSSLDQVLTQKEGLAHVSEGLYADKNGGDASYVATNQAGRDSLVAIMRHDRALLEQSYSVDGFNRSEQAALNDLDASIAELSQPASKMVNEKTGNCGTTQIYARATANGGTTASGYSVASNATGPVAATANFASTVIGSAYKNSSAVGAAPASVSDANPTSCYASSYATVTCPGASIPAVVAYGFSYRIGPGCFL
ncbi:hypothetical protein [Tahibacter sp.]|uniref:hypothetical protein n=1 Tax=Tahibacter sp. TaxID=2056211 RepID=UPI0028C43FD2|nr:hypothetical protein [Tahibacter sp.]